jgi:hypothetical protein
MMNAMPRTLPLGVQHDLPPVPYNPAETSFHEAGVLTIGVEYRRVDPDEVQAMYTEEQRRASVVTAALELQADEGVSIHVCERATGQEYLRFDCFDDDPHYHYIEPGIGNLAIAFDPVSNGDMLTWALACLRDRLPEMLVEAGAKDLVAELDPKALAAALEAVEDEARRAAA